MSSTTRLEKRKETFIVIITNSESFTINFHYLVNCREWYLLFEICEQLNEIKWWENHWNIDHSRVGFVVNQDSKIVPCGWAITSSKHTCNQKHPTLLHHEYQLSYLILEHEHKRQLHAGLQLLLACVKKVFWPLKGCKLARKIVGLLQCVVCFKTTHKPSELLMGSLPAAHVQQTRAFYNCGVDYCGPILLLSLIHI